MSAHTPGPWRQTGGRARTLIAAGQPARAIAAVVWHAGARDVEDDANAALIAAAPEMLEALRGLIACVYDGACGYKEQWTDTRPQIRAACAAIATAEGKS